MPRQSKKQAQSSILASGKDTCYRMLRDSVGTRQKCRECHSTRMVRIKGW